MKREMHFCTYLLSGRFFSVISHGVNSVRRCYEVSGRRLLMDVGVAAPLECIPSIMQKAREDYSPEEESTSARGSSAFRRGLTGPKGDVNLSGCRRVRVSDFG